MFKQTNQGENQNQKESYMAQLDGWIDEQVIEPLFEAWQFQERVADDEAAKEASHEVEETRNAVHKAIREKVLESYRNGTAKGGKPARSSFRRK